VFLIIEIEGIFGILQPFCHFATILPFFATILPFYNHFFTTARELDNLFPTSLASHPPTAIEVKTPSNDL